jgi:ribonuclease HII
MVPLLYSRWVKSKTRSRARVEKTKKWVAGVDEAGRGPLAGPVAVGVAVVPRDFDWALLIGVGDSKKVSVRHRELIARKAHALKRAGMIDFRVALIPHTTIDRVGISPSVRKGIQQCFDRLALTAASTCVKLDGLLTAPQEFMDQETIIKGDAKEKIIGLASILAKVARDAHMVRIAQKYPAYGFEIHKGYGTAAHRMRIHKYGLSPIHRRTFCRNIRGE